MRWVALMMAVAVLSCGRFGYDEFGAIGGDVDADLSDPIDSALLLVDAEPGEPDADMIPDAALAPIDAQPMPDNMLPGDDAAGPCAEDSNICPNQILVIGSMEIPEISESSVGFGDMFVASGCIAPLGDEEYTLAFSVEAPGDYIVGVQAGSLWYLLDGSCGGTELACSSSGGTQVVTLAAAQTYTLVVEETGGGGLCARWDGVIAGPI